MVTTLIITTIKVVFAFIVLHNITSGASKNWQKMVQILSKIRMNKFVYLLQIDCTFKLIIHFGPKFCMMMRRSNFTGCVIIDIHNGKALISMWIGKSFIIYVMRIGRYILNISTDNMNEFAKKCLLAYC